MRSFLPGRGASDEGDDLIDFFESLWQGGMPSLRAFWDEHGAGRPSSLLVHLVKVDLRNRYDRGERPAVAPYLRDFPELVASSNQVVSLIYEEFCLREEMGEKVDSREFCEAYEPWRDSLLSQLAYHRNLSQKVGRVGQTPRFPAPGDRFSRYTLGPLLGKGGMAHVFMATEDELAERKVAIKISARVGREASILAMLDHRNIVSLLNITDTDENGLRGICMPYRPGITLERLIHKFGDGRRPETARELWDLLGAPEEASADGNPSGWADFPVRGTFHDAVAWIGLCLANALTHAHDQKILHRDVKPANILLAFREGPQLLDFNLADDPKAPEEAKVAHQGGTLPYMSPEQLLAFLDPSAWEDVGAPADLFSLGLVLRELATGQAPAPPKECPSLARMIQSLIDRHAGPLVPARKFRPDIPPSLESILARCLEFDRRRRYAGARELAEDLRRFLDRRPLRHAPNTSIAERARNFGRRNRRRLVALAAGAIVLGLGLWANRPQPFHKSPEFAEAVADLDANPRPEKALATFEKFYKEHPNSAWSQLYRGLALQKLHRNGGEANNMFMNVVRSPDAEEALLGRLKAEPGSVFLLTELGLAYIAMDRWDDARRELERACDVPARDQISQSFGALGLVESHSAEVARTATERRAHLIGSVKSYAKAIELAGNPSSGSIVSMVLTWRLDLIKNANLATAYLWGDPPSRADREELRGLFDLIEANLSASNSTWFKKHEEKMQGSKAFCLAYYRGLALQGRAMLAKYEGDEAETIRLFDLATIKFEDALKAEPGDERALRRIEEIRRLDLTETQQGE